MMENLELQFAENLIRLRSKKEKTQKALSEELDISESAIRQYELGRCIPEGKTLIALANYFDVTLDYLLYGFRPSAKSDVGKLKIFKEDDRVAIAAIMVRNGFMVRQGKEKRTPQGKAFDYYLYITKSDEDADGDVNE
jgi:transcriptional regulator with XRE-family HTH domain